MLEDDFTYVIRKTLRALEMAPSIAASHAGIEDSAVMGLLAGRWNEGAARALAPVLGLDEEALVSHPDYELPMCDHPALRRLDLPFGEEQVNAWLVDCGDGKLLIDTGCDADALTMAIRETCALEEIGNIMITHNHRDHVGGLGLFEGRGVSIHGPGAEHAWNELRPGDLMECGELQLRMFDLSGHAVPALGILISGLDVPMLATGDAMFAGSIGGCPGREIYDLARKTLFEVLSGMDEQTLLLTGHGPPSRLAEEWRRNPFLAAMRCP